MPTQAPATSTCPRSNRVATGSKNSKKDVISKHGDENAKNNEDSLEKDSSENRSSVAKSGPRVSFDINCGDFSSSSTDSSIDQEQQPSIRRASGDTQLAEGLSSIGETSLIKPQPMRISMSSPYMMKYARNNARSHERCSSLDMKEFSSLSVGSLEEFVAMFDGKRVISKVLIANNGIAAVKCMRSIRRWAYEVFRNDRAIKFVAMVTPEDLKANAEYIRMADQFVCIPGGTNNNNYANVQLICDMAKKMEVQAVWAGWGHASENPKLPELLSKHNIVFIGPPAKAMWSLGDKIASTIVAQTADVPTMQWSGSDLKLDYTKEDLAIGRKIVVPPEIYTQATVTQIEEGVKLVSKIGCPVMIKASEGGGGKGIRKCQAIGDFPTLFRQVQAEVPGSPIFIMKLAKDARHLEVQVLADEYGNAISLFGRDCSIQRRHQKIIEEAPTTIAPPEIFEEMELDAIKLAKMVGYISAGTVEYLFMPETNEYYFLELNPRLQVEHPCTEMVSNVNLPAAQIQIAMGVPLHRIKDIRLMYGEAPWGDTRIDFFNPPEKPLPRGHVIAARITSENPDEGFQPSSGTVQELNFRSSKNVWGYFSVSASGGLHEFCDSQFGHCFSWGETRDEARANMALALKELSIRGDFRTTVEYLIKLLETEDFIDNNFDTAWLDKLIAEKVRAEKPDVMIGVICTSVLIADASIINAFQDFQNSLERGQVLPANSLTDTVDVELTHEGVKYCVQVTRSGPQNYYLMMNGSGIVVETHRMSDGGLLLSYNFNSYTCYLKQEVDKYRVQIGNKTIEFEKNNDPTQLRSPSTGKLVQYLVEDGGHVSAGSPFVEIEVMKMIMTLTVSESGCIHYIKRSGAVLGAGTVIARLALDDPSRVKTATRYDGIFPVHSPIPLHTEKLPQTFRDMLDTIKYVLDGYTMPEPPFSQELRECVERLFLILKDPQLPLLELQDAMAVISGRIPPEVEKQVRQLMTNYAGNITSVLCQFPSQQIAEVIDKYASRLQKKQEREVFFMTTQALLSLVQRYRGGTRGHLKIVIQDILKQYLNTELFFEHHQYDKSVTTLRDRYKDDMAKVTRAIFSHSQIHKKNHLIILLMDHISAHEPGLTEELKEVLSELTTLGKAEHSKVALRARQILIASHQPSYDTRHNQVESIFLSAVDKYSQCFQPDNLNKLITSETSIFDVLHDFFFHSNKIVKMAALEVYVRRAYTAYDMNCLQHHDLLGNLIAVEYQFTLPNTHPSRLRCTHRRTLSKADGLNSAALRGQTSRVRSSGDDEMLGLDLPDSPNCQRLGILVAVNSFEELTQSFNVILQQFTLLVTSDSGDFEGKSHSNSNLFQSEDSTQKEPILILNVAIRVETIPNSTSASSATAVPSNIVASLKTDDNAMSDLFQNFVYSKKQTMFEKGIRRVTFMLLEKRSFPKYFTFRARDKFMEDKIYRHLEPAISFQLEITRMKNFTLTPIATSNRRMHLYLGSAKTNKGVEVNDYRFFLRSLVRHQDLISKEASFEYMRNEGERVLLEALDELEVAFSTPEAKRSDCNHIFLNFVPCVTLDPQKVVDTVRDIVVRYGLRLWKLRVLQAELKYMIRLTPNGLPVSMRLTVSNESGYYLDVHLYQEILDDVTGQVKFVTWGSGRSGPLHGLPVSTPYQTKDHMQSKRYLAQKMGTTYVFDYPEMFRQALMKLWREYKIDHPDVDEPNLVELLHCTELVVDEKGHLVEMNRLPGENECSMVAWRLTLKTPEFPNGRDLIVIANDMTHLIGSFGVKEDELFARASEMSRQKGLPRAYIASNSGARIGLAEEVKNAFRVAWDDPEQPDRGFKYIYLTPEDYKRVNLCCNAVNCELIEENGESRYKIVDVIGREDSLGVENLKGSGMIAGETSDAYNEVWTCSMVSCRSVGIGAYLVRLGQRVIQVENSSIILTGAMALNKVLGREVYTSNNQLGGIQIMYNNGVSHATVHNDFEGVYTLLKWLSYVPDIRGGLLPVLPPIDPVDREIDFCPTKNPYDPRWMLEGRKSMNDPTKWENGFFDVGSWVEIMPGWAKTVVCGRARLGGIPCAAIAVETRSVEVEIPADPATLDSETKVVNQAGQVWYPDSAYKTAQAIKDFNREELPLFIFANWRGFSGGMKDMYEQVLKFGAYIVDGLREYRQPVFVYLPPHAELRGGAWVVVDPAINVKHMEMYADPDSRGGVLEPEGTVEIKYRFKDLQNTIHRLDTVAQLLLKQLHTNEKLTEDEKKNLQQELKRREEHLLPIYHTVAVQFVDLHDTAGRMCAKNVISGAVQWKTARQKFYWRLRRRLAEDRLRANVWKESERTSDTEQSAMLRAWFTADKKELSYDDDMQVALWFEKQLVTETTSTIVEERVKLLKRSNVKSKITNLLAANPELLMDSMIEMAQHLSGAQCAELSKVIANLRSHNNVNRTNSL